MAGTLLAVAAVIVPAALARPPVEEVAHRPYLMRALPYIGLLTVGVALATGEFGIDDSGDGASHEMLIAAAGTALIATFVALIADDRSFWRGIAAAAVGVGLVTVSGLNPSAMDSTKWAAFASAAGIALVAGWTAVRPPLRLRTVRENVA